MKNDDSILICLDYDKTFTLAPDLWLDFITLIKSKGHRVICATMRHEHEGEEVKKDLDGICEKIIFTCRQAKMEYLHNLNIYPDIWIDDSPYYILNNSR